MSGPAVGELLGQLKRGTRFLRRSARGRVQVRASVAASLNAAMLFLRGLVGFLVLLTGMVAALHAGAALTARLLRVPAFRWFDSQPAKVALWRQFGVRLGSALAPLGVCIGLFWCGYFFAGQELPTTTVLVIQGPAQTAGMRDGDRVVAIDGASIDSWDALRATLRLSVKERLVEIERAGSKQVLRIAPSADGRIGVVPKYETRVIGLGDSLRRAASMPFHVVGEMLRSATTDLNGTAELRGPVGIVRETEKDRRSGWFVLFLGLLGSCLWAYLVGLHLFDAATLLLFRMTHPESHATEQSGFRLCRLHQTLVITLILWLGLMLLVSTMELELVGRVALPATLALMPAALALYPLIWIMGSQLAGRGRTAALLLPSLFVPCVAPIAASWLLVRARRELRQQGFKLGWFVATKAP